MRTRRGDLDGAIPRIVHQQDRRRFALIYAIGLLGKANRLARCGTRFARELIQERQLLQRSMNRNCIDVTDGEIGVQRDFAGHFVIGSVGRRQLGRQVMTESNAVPQVEWLARGFQDNRDRIVGRAGAGDVPVRQAGPAVRGLARIGRRAKPWKTNRNAAANGFVVREQRLAAHEQKRMGCSRGLEMRDVRSVQKELPFATLERRLSNDQTTLVEIKTKSVRDGEVRFEFQQGLRWRSHGLFDFLDGEGGDKLAPAW